MVGSDAMEVGPGGVNGQNTTAAIIDMDTRVRRLCAAVLVCAYCTPKRSTPGTQVTLAVINLRTTLQGGAPRVAYDRMLRENEHRAR
jgi:hypothetical protein